MFEKAHKGIYLVQGCAHDIHDVQSVVHCVTYMYHVWINISHLTIALPQSLQKVTKEYERQVEQNIHQIYRQCRAVL